MGVDVVANQARLTWDSNVMVVMFSLVYVDMVGVKVVVERGNMDCAGE